jgi:hypothetical protein
MRTFTTLAASAALAAVATTARADPPRITAHVEAAFSLLGGAHVTSTSFRGYAGAAIALGAPAADHVFVGGGLHVGSGALHVHDPRALDGSLELTYGSIGPEVRVGYTFADGGYVDSQLYAAFAPTTVSVDDRLRLDAVPGIRPGHGFRAAIGVTYGDRYYPAAAAALFDGGGHGHGANGTSSAALAAFLIPVTLEVEVERGAGSDRYGVSLGWGF